MIIDPIKQRLTNGFKPFALCLSDGRRLTVPHRDFIAISPRLVVVIDSTEHSHTINPIHIVSIEEEVPKA